MLLLLCIFTHSLLLFPPLPRRQAYKALAELKAEGKIDSIGVGAKDITAIGCTDPDPTPRAPRASQPRVTRRALPYHSWTTVTVPPLDHPTALFAGISDHVQLDWAMFACSITPYTHSDYAKDLLKKLAKQGCSVINSAVFNAGAATSTQFGTVARVIISRRHAAPHMPCDALFLWCPCLAHAAWSVHRDEGSPLSVNGQGLHGRACRHLGAHLSTAETCVRDRVYATVCCDRFL